MEMDSGPALDGEHIFQIALCMAGAISAGAWHHRPRSRAYPDQLSNYMGGRIDAVLPSLYNTLVIQPRMVSVTGLYLLSTRIPMIQTTQNIVSGEDHIVSESILVRWGH